MWKPYPRTALRPKDLVHELRDRNTDASSYRRAWEPRLAVKPTLARPISQPCSANQIYQVKYRQWVDEMHQPFVMHRKQWEWVYILQSLQVNGCLEPGKRGLGFGVGTEPISAIAAKRGARVLATDAPYENAEGAGWTETNQHVGDQKAINVSDICPQDEFDERVSFRVVDMRNVPDDIGNDFDFTWSACAFEHLGSLEAGFAFVERSIEALAPGGFAVHTTEYNVSSNDATTDSGHTVLYRRRDFEAFAKRLRQKGHKIDLTFGLGDTEDDRHIDDEPYTNCHLKVRSGDFVITSYGLTIQKAR
jgi:2-polyprenyl-3-methyl-5-hydroxy-6-metoxy-1,4-benzoquinol methylase